MTLALSHAANAGAADRSNRPGADRVGSVGRPLAHVRVRIADDGEIMVAEYVTFLGQAYHHVSQTGPLLMGAGYHLPAGPSRTDPLRQPVLPVVRRHLPFQIVNIGSMFGSIGFPGFATYSTSKFALRGILPGAAARTGEFADRDHLRLPTRGQDALQPQRSPYHGGARHIEDRSGQPILRRRAKK
ncbi:MAG: hypothetical protein EPN49_13980 [Rhodanobacter sp.]|nr:MAG: hypothetical protein EPN49_13980 [Rhodanobacter sp.]